jgi:acetyl-CoA synthetase
VTTVDAKLAEWLERYGGEDVSLGALLCDSHPSEAIALVFDGPDGVRRLSYGELGERSARLAGSLRELGVQQGDRVAVMLPKSPELLVSLVAVWRAGAVHVPLFTAFGPDAAGFRITHSGARLVITDGGNREKVTVEGVPVMTAAEVGPGSDDLSLSEAIERGEALDDCSLSGDDLMILLYTSGTTGNPKGVEVPVRSLASVHSYMHYGLDLRPDDVFWNVSDPGWGYGLWFGLVGPMLLGQATLLRGVAFDAESAFAAILEHGVTNLAGAPTVYRALRAGGVPEDFRERSDLRVASSAGEPLNAELLAWSARELGVAIHDHYGQSELGMVTGFPHHPELQRDPVPGSMGISSPGFQAVIVGEDGELAEDGVDGELAIDVEASPLYWFRGYYQDPERTAERFRHGPAHYLTADAARKEDGLLYFASRADDVITSSGYRIGPFEVENALMAHDAVAEVAVIGTPDELRGEAVTAFIVTTGAGEGSTELADELKEFVRARLAKHLYPRSVHFVDALPRTPSGKVKRNVLRVQGQAEQPGA